MMQYIENYELREWVKKSLRKTIFLKAHELATQTGCEVLLKIRDEAENAGDLYYATDSLQKEYSDKGLCKQPNEICISGETGMPVYPRVNTATQSVESEAIVSDSNDSQNAQSVDTASQDTTLPLHLTVSNETPQSDDSPHVEQIDEPIVKLEVIEEPENETDNSMDMSGMMGADESMSSMQASDDGQLPFGMQDLDNSPLSNFPVASSPKLYQCAVCQKAFRSVQVLQKHTQTFHVKTQMSALIRHRGRSPGIRTAASGRPLAQKRYTCTVCSRSFPFVALLNDHMTRSHMMASTASYSQGATEEQSQFDTNEGNMETGEEAMPKISQVMSLQPTLLHTAHVAASSSHVPYPVDSPTAAAVFHSPGPSTSGASTSSGVTMKGSPRNTPASRYYDATTWLRKPRKVEQTDVALITMLQMPKNSHGEVILWEKTYRKSSSTLWDYKCCFPSCDIKCDSIREIRIHAMNAHGAGRVFCAWCKERRTYMRPNKLQEHVKQMHPSKRDFVDAILIEHFSVLPELWPQIRKYVKMEDPDVRHLIEDWWELENERRKRSGIDIVMR